MTKQWPAVTVGVITYDRLDEIQATLEALHDNLTYSGELRYIIANDSSPGQYVSSLKRKSIIKALKADIISTDKNGGWGVNANMLVSEVANSDASYLFFIEDDYVLKHPLNLDIGVALMEANPRLGMLRYRGTAGTSCVYHQAEVDCSEWLPDYREGQGSLMSGRITYLVMDAGSPTLWLYSNGPHLKRADFHFHKHYGPYPTGLKLGATEESYAHTVKNTMRARPNDAPWIGILPEWIPMRFDHIGTSYQGTEQDK